MKLTAKHYLILLLAGFVIATGILTYKLISESQRAEALEASKRIYEKDMKALILENDRLNDSITKVKKQRAQEIALRDQKIENLLENIDEILQAIPQNEAHVDSLPQEEIEKLHKRYYPNEQTAKADAVKKAQRVEVLEVAIQKQGAVISEQAVQINSLKQQVTDSELQNALWKKNYQLLNTQYEAEKASKPKDKTLAWILRMIAAGAVGFVVGSLAN